ncbi:hypothetical protein [Microbacterium sp. PMB16]|uniref:hypothetical protein n=1 Tax=Microbacterium sp. PMB16 TaxID=3120157 RepID=UPI003F4B5D89
MIQSPQRIEASRDGVVHEATISWQFTPDYRWTVSIESPSFDAFEATENDAFEALCTVREHLEPQGWRLGVVGAQIDVWPSGMARDQGGGKAAYRISARGAGAVVQTFEPADPATVTTVAEQRAAADQWFDLSAAVVVYLTNFPGRNDAEFEAQFGSPGIREAVRVLLDETIAIQMDWAGRTLNDIGDEVERVMHARHPELTDAALKSLGDYFTYLVK